jgi:hypothetical protein
MNFNKHSRLEGSHAFLSASKPSWLNYDEEKLDRMFFSSLASQRGTELHNFASDAIRLRVKLERNRQTLNRYVNDAVGYRMTPEQILYYSDDCYGCADAISFRDNFLRIHDLKTGLIPAGFDQLEIYAALFCLEYGVKPFEIQMELRIYQNDEVKVHIPEPARIFRIMDHIITMARRISENRMEIVR